MVGWFIGLVMVGLWEHKKGWNSWFLRKCSNIRVDFHVNHITEVTEAFQYEYHLGFSAKIPLKFHLDHPWSKMFHPFSENPQEKNLPARSPPASQPADVGSSPSCAATSVAGEDSAGRPAGSVRSHGGRLKLRLPGHQTWQLKTRTSLKMQGK